MGERLRRALSRVDYATLQPKRVGPPSRRSVNVATVRDNAKVMDAVTSHVHALGFKDDYSSDEEYPEKQSRNDQSGDRGKPLRSGKTTKLTSHDS